MINILCGLIGGGKTTYAKTNFKYFTDLDFMPAYSTKIDQIALTKKLEQTFDRVCHITCYPTDEELQAFKKHKVKYYWIDTDPNQAKTNILIRSRDRDLANLTNVIKANQEYQQKFLKSDIDWNIVKVF